MVSIDPPACSHPLRILIVEDEALVALEIEEALSAAGHEVAGHADDLAGAVALGRRTRPDLALVDINLANRCSGLDVAAELMRCGIPCLFVTGNCPTHQGEGLALGCLHKPFNDRILLGAVAAAGAVSRGEEPPRLPRGMHLYDGPVPGGAGRGDSPPRSA